MSDLIRQIKRIPPVTRFLCGSTLLVTLPTIMEMIPVGRVVFVWPLVVHRLEIWRLYTNFFYGGAGIGFIFAFAMLYRDSEHLESNHFARRSPDYAWQVMLASCAILGITRPLGSMVHFRPLSLSIMTMNAKLAPPGSQTSLFGLLSLPVEYLPYAMVVLDLIVGGPSAAAEAVAGVLVGWGWWLVRTSGGADAQRISRAPELLKRFVPEGGEVATAGVQVVPPSGRAGTTSATTSGHSWGSGRRLGR